MAHIADQVREALIADGWAQSPAPGGGLLFDKLIVGWGFAGVMVPDGRRRVYVHVPAMGRWLARLDGWSEVEKEIDLREYDDAAAAIAAILVKGA